MAGVCGLLLLLLCVHQIIGEHGQLKMRQRQGEVQQLELEVSHLEEENQRLEQHVQRLQSDPAAIERIAREEMKLARPGEIIFTLPAPPPREARAQPPAH